MIVLRNVRQIEYVSNQYLVARKSLNESTMRKYGVKHKLSLAPSLSLLYATKNGEKTWEQYKQSYLKELYNMVSMSDLRSLCELSVKIDVYLYCYCSNKCRCHLSIIKEICERNGYSVRWDY